MTTAPRMPTAIGSDSPFSEGTAAPARMGPRLGRASATSSAYTAPITPSSTKMSETPALKASELMMTARLAAVRDPPPSPFKCSTLTPEMSET